MSTYVFPARTNTAEIELDGQIHPLSPGTAVLIQPGCRHLNLDRQQTAEAHLQAYARACVAHVVDQPGLHAFQPQKLKNYHQQYY